MNDALERQLGRKILLRLVVPSALFVLMGAIDKGNVSFAAIQMNDALGLSGTQYGFGAGVLYVGYLVAKYPSVLLFEKIGMARWLGLITIAWGLAATTMAGVRDEWELYGLRVVVGFAEGGLSSGLMIYLSHWATDRYRASILSIPIMSISIAQVIGAPLSGALLEMENPLGLEGWRFMFLVEGIPAVLLGIFAWFYYPDSPAGARWLKQDERDWLAANVRAAATHSSNAGHDGRWAALRSPVGWICGLIWFCILASNYGVIFWLPTIVKGMSDLTPVQIGWVVALPWAGSAIGLYFNAMHSDRTQERYFHVGVPALVGAVGLLAAYLLGPGIAGLLALLIGGACTGCTVAAFWAIPTRLIPPDALAMGIVMINILGGFAGAIVPPAMGYSVEATGNFLAPVLIQLGLAATCFAACIIARSIEAREASGGQQPATA